MAQRGPDLRIVFHQVLQGGAQAQELRVQDGADAQFALHRVAQGADGALEIFHGVQDAQRGRQQRASVRVRRQPLRRARKKRQVQRFLEVLQLQAKRGLGHVQVFRRARQVAFPRHGGKGADVLQVHGAVRPEMG
ncbi:hypothetical protein D3C73_1326830 [compost metagenome]